MSSKSTSKQGKKTDTARNGAGLDVKVGDVVLVHPERKDELPYVARVNRIEETASKRDYVINCTWYYRSKETYAGAQGFHGENEVFLSDHDDNIRMSNVQKKIRVHSLEDYCNLPHRSSQLDFYCRHQYKATDHMFEPLTIPVFCHCGRPFNPDHGMVCCGECSEWYHLECVGISSEQLSEMVAYSCPQCKSRRT